MNEEIESLLHSENLQLAKISKRATAFFIDELLLSLLLLVVLWDSFSTLATTEELIAFTNSFVFEYMVLKIVYQTFFVHIYSATLGKLFMHIQVIDISTLSNPSVVVSLNRAVIRVVSESLFYLGFLWGAITPERQTWHDKTAKTLVIDA